MRVNKKFENAESLLKECLDSHVVAGQKEQTYVNLVIELGHTFRVQQKFVESLLQYQKALEIGIEMTNGNALQGEIDDVMATAYYYSGWVSQNLGNLDDAKEMLGKSLTISKKEEWKGWEWRTQNRLGSVERTLGDFPQAEPLDVWRLTFKSRFGESSNHLHEVGPAADEIGNHFSLKIGTGKRTPYL